jgi:transposase
MPEFGQLEQGQAAGLAPIANDSGKSSGQAISAADDSEPGRPFAGLPSTPCGSIRIAKAKYDAMIKAGKPKKVALVAVMRKLAVLANALLHDRKWSPQRA